MAKDIISQHLEGRERGQLGVHSKFEAILGYVRLSFKTKERKRLNKHNYPLEDNETSKM